VSIKVLCLTALWQRPEITAICFRGLCRLREEIDLTALAVHSGGYEDLCQKYDVIPVEHRNLPLGEKWNFGLMEALKYDWDYLLTLGSDDLLSGELLKLYTWQDEAAGINRCGIFDTLTGKTAIFENSYAIGCGRVIRRDVIERMGDMVTVKYRDCHVGAFGTIIPGKQITISRYFMDRIQGQMQIISEQKTTPKLWGDDLNQGLDFSSDCLLNANGVIQKIYLSDKILALDLKSGVNIWPFDHYTRKEFTIDWLSKDEEDAIRRLRPED
jgi:hypothetical protein